MPLSDFALDCIHRNIRTDGSRSADDKRADRSSIIRPGRLRHFDGDDNKQQPNGHIEIRNLTIYWPWAQYVNGQWPSGANTTQNLSPWPLLGSSQSGSNIKTYSYSFSVPSWFAGSLFGTGSLCPGGNGPRYSTSYHGCVIVGFTASPPRYSNLGF